MSLMRHSLRAVSAAAVLLAAGSAQAVSPWTFQKIIMYTDAVPGVPGATWDTSISTSIYSTPIVFNDGSVAFQGRFIGGDVTSANRAGVWAGMPGATSLVARDGSAGPTLANPNSWQHNGFLGTGAGLSTNVAGTQSGVLMLSSSLGSTSNSGSASNGNNTAFWTGAPTTAGMNLVAQGGGVSPSVAPGTSNSVFSTSLALNLGLAKVNSAGQSYFGSNLVAGAGGDAGLITGTWSTANLTNDSGVWMAKPGAGNMVAIARESQSITSLPQVGGVNPILGDIATTVQNPHLNSSGQMIFSQNLRSGFAGVNNTAGTANDGVLWAASDGTLTPIARKNDPIPGIAGKTYNNTGSLGFATNSQAFNNDGRLVFNALYTGGGDALMTWKDGENGSVAHPLLKQGDAAPGISGNTFSSFNGSNPNTRLNNNNYVAFAATATDGSASTSGIWGGALGAGGDFSSAPALLVSQGMLAPGMGDGVTFASGFFGVIMNNLNQIVFQASLAGTGVTTSNDSVLCAYDPNSGLSILVREGVDNGTTLGIPGFGTVGSFSANGNGTGDGGSQALSDTGWLALRLVELGANGNNALVVTQIPAPGAAALLGLAGLVGSRRRRR